MIRIVHNLCDEDCFITDIGLDILAGDSYDFSDWDLDVVRRAKDLFQLIDEGKLALEIDGDIIVDTAEEAKLCFTPVTQFTMDKVVLNRVDAINLSHLAECFLANILNVIFKTHTEKILLKDYLKNVFVFMGKEYYQLSFWENVVIVNEQIELQPKGREVCLKAYKKTDNVDTDGSIDELTLNVLDDELDIMISGGHVGDAQVLLIKPDNIHWKKYDYVYCDVDLDLTTAVQLSFIMGDSVVPNSMMQLGAGRTRCYFSIAGILKKKINQYGFKIKLLSENDSINFKIGNLIGVDKKSVAIKGTIKTEIQETTRPIKEVYICNNWELLSDDSLVMFLSLDGGNNWQLVAQNQLETWLDVKDWSMTAYDKLMLKYEWKVFDGKSAILDDCFVMYRL